MMDLTEKENIEDSDEEIIDGIGDDDEEIESHLPAEIVIPHKMRPNEESAIIFEDEQGERKYIGSDGKTRTEPLRSKTTFERYLMMGADRSLPKLASILAAEQSEGWTNVFSEQSALKILREYSRNFDWQNRIRLHVIKQSGVAVANAQRKAARSKHERIRRSQKLQQIAEAIFDQAALLGDADEFEQLTPEEARQLLKPATQMMQIGLAAERAEVGESMSKLIPPIPIEAMDAEQLDAFIATLRSEL